MTDTATLEHDVPRPHLARIDEPTKDCCGCAASSHCSWCRRCHRCGETWGKPKRVKPVDA